jgi:hypothetical protein
LQKHISEIHHRDTSHTLSSHFFTMPSALGHKADAAFVTIANAGKLFSNHSTAFKLAGAFTTFSAVTLPMCAITSTVSGIYATAKFLELGQTISEDVKKLAESVDITVSLQYQAFFAQHVHNFTAARIQAAKDQRRASGGKESDTDYFFIYHPGTDWHASFEALISKKPLPTLLGKTNSLDLISRFVADIRSSIGVSATVHILMPSAHMYLIPEEFSLHQSLSPLVFEGETAYSTQPYVYLNMPEVPDSHLHQIGRLQSKKASTKKPANESVRTLVSTSAAVPAGIFGGFGGAILGVAGVLVLAPFAGPALLVGGAVAAGAALGTTTAMGTGLIVEKVYDSHHEKKK